MKCPAVLTLYIILEYSNLRLACLKVKWGGGGGWATRPLQYYLVVGLLMMFCCHEYLIFPSNDINLSPKFQQNDNISLSKLKL